MNILPLILHFCDAIWEYCVSTNEVFFHYDAMAPELCGRWMPYDKINTQYQEIYVYPLDIEIWRHYLTPEAFRRFYDGKREEEHFYIRLENTQKGKEWHEVYLQKAGEDRLFLASRDTREMQRSSAIAKAVGPEFDYVCRINTTDGSYVLYCSDENRTVIPRSASGSYERLLEEFNRRYVVPEEADVLTEQMRLDRVKKELEQKEEYILYATIQDGNSLSYKQLRFSYENEEKEYLFLTRTDVGALMRERKRREGEKARRMEYLENMPVAFSSIKMLLDEAGKPYDFRFTYCNRAHDELVGVKAGELIGENFYEFFRDGDPKWLKYYYETAYEGGSHVIRSYSPEIQKYLLIYTFCLEEGHCGCVLLDETEQHFLFHELEHSRETMKRILEITTDQVFQYLPEQKRVILEDRQGRKQQSLTGDALTRIMTDEFVHPDCREGVLAGFRRINEGEHSVSFVVQGRSSREAAWKWFRITMFDFQDGHTHERKVLGFWQNIDEFRSREEALKKKAEQDSLTEVLNAGAGKRRISEKLEQWRDGDSTYYAMFVMDLDNFKAVNDTMGHMIGDEALVTFARILRRTFRKEDVIYRLGGDEFVVFVEGLKEPEPSVQGMLNRLMGHVREEKEERPFLACSAGVWFSNRKCSFKECYQMADQALYEAKRNGKGRSCIKADSGNGFVNI